MSDKNAWACVILHEEGETFTEIGEKLGRHKTTVSRAVERYREYGTPLPQPRNCKNTATTPDQDKDIIRYSRNHPFDVSRKIKERLHLTASLATVKRRLKENDLAAHRPARKPRLTDLHKIDRVEWCTERMSIEIGVMLSSAMKLQFAHLTMGFSSSEDPVV